MKRQTAAQLLADVMAKLNNIEHGNGVALPAEPMPEVVKMASAPAWLTEARRAVTKAVPKAKAKAPSGAPRWEATFDTYTPPKGEPIHGVRIVKMFGEEVDRRNPYGKFLTLAAAEAVFALLASIPTR